MSRRMSQRLSRFLDTVTLRSRRSWMYWRQKRLLRRMRREQRLLETLQLQVLRQREKLAELERRATPQVLVMPSELSPEEENQLQEEVLRRLGTLPPPMPEPETEPEPTPEEAREEYRQPLENPGAALEEISQRLGLTRPLT